MYKPRAKVRHDDDGGGIIRGLWLVCGMVDLVGLVVGVWLDEEVCVWVSDGEEESTVEGEDEEVSRAMRPVAAREIVWSSIVAAGPPADRV